MVRIPKLKQSNRYDFRSGMSPGVDPGSPHAEGWGQIGQMIGDIAYKLGDAYFKQKEKEEVLASKIVSSDYEKNLKSKISVIMADPANKNKDIVPMVDEVIKNTHAEWFKESKDVNGNPIPNRASKVDNFNREKFFKTNGETIKTTEQLYRNEGIKFQLIHGAKTYSKTLHANGTAELKNLVKGIDLTSPESRANGLAEVYAKGKGFVTKLLLNQWREENAPEMSEKDFEEFLTQRGAVAGGSGRFFNEFEKWAEGNSSRKSLELHANTIIGTSLKEKVKTAMGKYAADKSNFEKLKTYYDGSVLPQWAKDTIKFIKKKKELGVDVDDLEKQLKIELKKGYDVLEGIERKNESQEDEDTIKTQHTYARLHKFAVNHENSNDLNGGELLEAHPNFDLEPEEKRTILGLSGKALKDHLASIHNEYSNLRHDKRGSLISSESLGISIGRQHNSLASAFNYDHDMMRMIADGTWDKKEAKKLLDRVEADNNLTNTDKVAVTKRIDQARTNRQLYKEKREVFKRLMRITGKLTQASGKFNKAHIGASEFKRQLWRNIQVLFHNNDESPEDMVKGLTKFVSNQHYEAASEVQSAITEYEEVQQGPAGIGTSNKINDYLKKDFFGKPIERRREFRALKKAILEEKVVLQKHLERKESNFMGVPTSGIKSHFFGDPIPNPKEQMEALDKLEDSLKLYNEVSQVRVGILDIDEEKELRKIDIGYAGEIITDAIHPYPNLNTKEPKPTENPQVERQSVAGEQ